MQSVADFEMFVNRIWSCIDLMRGQRSLKEIYASVIYILYGYHKQYGVLHSDRRTNELGQQIIEFDSDDVLLHDLFVYPKPKMCDMTILYRELCNWEHEFFEEHYADLILKLNDLVALNGGMQEGGLFTPVEISKLIAYFVKQEKCNSVYDPFCGTAALSFALDDIPFVGQDIMPLTTLIARVIADSLNKENAFFSCADSLLEWQPAHFDAVVSCPPLAMKLTEQQKWVNQMSDWRCDSLDDIIFTRSLQQNTADLVVVLETFGFCYRGGSYKELRKYLVDNNYLDTVILLPENLLYGTSVPTVLVTCRRNRKLGDKVRFIYAEDCFIGESRRKRVLDINRVLAMIDQNDPSYVVEVDINLIQQYDYNFHPNLYVEDNTVLEEGQRKVLLSEILTAVEMRRVDAEDRLGFVGGEMFSKNFIEILLNKNKLQTKDVSASISARCYKPQNDEQLLLLIDSLVGTRYALYSREDSFSCSGNTRGFRINTDVVIPEYLVYVLLTNKVIQRGGMPFSCFLNHRVVIDSIKKQQQIVDKQIHEYELRQEAEHKADMQRLGVKRNISDMEHMIGSTQFRINQIVSRLERITPDDGNYRTMVKSLKDNIDYMSRMIHFTNTELGEDSFNMKNGNIVEFINSYIDGWKNYGGNYFTLETSIDEEEIESRYDKTLLTVMFDAILSNAVYHGFHKMKNYTPRNTVEISMSCVEYNEKPYACFKIANNGDPINEDFTLEDYISKGRYSSATGRSGLGGYHVHQIVKGHDGYLFLDSSKQWNVIFEILLPIEVSDKSLVHYEHECI